MSKNAHVIETMTKQIELSLKMVDICTEMRNLCYIANLLDEKVSNVKGKVKTYIVDRKHKSIRPWLGKVFVIKIDGEKLREIPLKEVPLDLWHADDRSKFLLWKKQQDKLRKTRRTT